ncbi:MAG: hypothetical protein VZR27_12710 [Acutalibacteraceae bacterium]|nr:hypothetical protein [Acutalibacteraceae bacterium]
MERESVMVFSLEECKELQENGYELFAVSDWVYSPDSKAYHLYKPE